MSFNPLIEKIVHIQNPSVVGLDPKLEYIPSFLKKACYEKHGEGLKGAAKAFLKFNKGIIDAVHDIVPAVKPQSAFYEALGVEGIKALYKTCEYAKARGMYVILDGKRNDIGSTAEGYAQAYLGKMQVGANEYSPFPTDALTVNGYLGSDGILPFTEACEKYDKGIFVLVKTSNPSSGELQDRILDIASHPLNELTYKDNKQLNNNEQNNEIVKASSGELTEADSSMNGALVYEIMGRLCEEWGKKTTGNYGYSAVGVVMGATYPEQITIMREMLPNTFFLVPGYGAQGGTSEDLKAAFDSRGLGAIVNNSRGILCAYQKEKCDEKDFAGAARRAALSMRDDIMKHIGEIKI